MKFSEAESESAGVTMQVQPWARKTRCLVVFIAACCAALTELVLDDSNAHQVVQVRGRGGGGGVPGHAAVQGAPCRRPGIPDHGLYGPSNVVLKYCNILANMQDSILYSCPYPVNSLSFQRTAM